MFRVCLIFVLFFTAIRGRPGIGDTEQDWGYITVRPNAHMFWWLYYTTYNNVSNYTDRPLIMWLQGGPGMPASGYGNFLEMGPLNSSFIKRKGSFVENFNVLFLDNPVGVGYSYFSDNSTRMVTNGDEVAEDLYSFLKIFMAVHEEFKDVPLYIFGESYGGKMATEFVYLLTQRRKKKKICNLKGLGLGDAYISPIDYVEHYAPLALNLGLVDKRGFTRIDEWVKQIRVLISNKDYGQAAELENISSSVLYSKTLIDMNNFISEIKPSINHGAKLWDDLDDLEGVMDDEIKRKLNITADVTWLGFRRELYDSLHGDFIRGVTDKVETLLNTTDIKIIVYNGILDVIVNTAGTIAWLDRLKWKGREEWHTIEQTPLIIDEVSEGYFKRVDNLVFYAVLRAGHSVPIDNLPVMNEILREELLS